MHLHQEVLEQAVWEKSYRLAAVAYEKATITASAIHDLQSPLSGMRNLLDLARGNREVLAGEPGWNAVWLTVDPADTTPSKVFAEAPISEAWCWFPMDKTVEFISDPASGLFNVPGWSVYIPATLPTAFLSNLGAAQGHRAYLADLAGTGQRDVENQRHG